MAIEQKAKTSKAKQYKKLSYAALQKKNRIDRGNLSQENQIWLKKNSYNNVGWDNIIRLHEKILEILEQIDLEELSLEDLFLEADRIGNKYQTAEEIEQFRKAMAQEAEEIAEIIDRQFPHAEIEVIDFSQLHQRKSKSRHQQKIYRTVSP